MNESQRNIEYVEAQIEHAKAKGAQARIDAGKRQQKYKRLPSWLHENPYQRTGNEGKKLKAAWHNAYREQDKLING